MINEKCCYRYGQRIDSSHTGTVALFLDVANIGIALREHEGMQVEVSSLLNKLTRGREIAGLFAYLPLPPEHEQINGDWRVLTDAGFHVRWKRGKVLHGGKWKSNLDVELTVDAFRLAVDTHPETICIVSGDGDFTALVRALQEEGVRVEIAAHPRALAKELIGIADEVIYLTSHQEFLLPLS